MMRGSMRFLDHAAAPRVSVFLELVESIGRESDPDAILGIISEGMCRAYADRGCVHLSTEGLAPGEYRVIRATRPGGANVFDPAPMDRWGALPTHRGGVLGRICRSPGPKIAHDANFANEPALADAFADMRSFVAAPIYRGASPSHWVALLYPGPEQAAAGDLEELILRANFIALSIDNLVTQRQLVQANLKIQQEIENIAAIQRALLPERLPDVPGLRIAASYQVFDQAGGDLYDIVPLGRRPEWLHDGKEDRWAILVADASGHGPSAAVVMAMLNGIVRSYPRIPAGPAELLEHANRNLCAKRIGSSMVTAFLGFYEPQTRRLQYARAGHHPPLLLDGPRVTQLDAVGDLPLGVAADLPFDQTELTLRPGQSLALYTDGIPEAFSPDGEWFGLERLRAVLASSGGEPLRFIAQVNDAVRGHQAGAPAHDDQTVVAIQVV
mgnify:CR=1 FL=1